MAFLASKPSIIVSQEGLVPFKLSQLSPAISNAKVIVKGIQAPHHALIVHYTSFMPLFLPLLG